MIDLTEQQCAIIQRILSEELPSVEVRAFGSRIKGTAKPYSDLDLALMTHLPLTIRQQRKLEEAFSDSSLPFKVDLIDWASCSDEFKALISENYVVFPMNEHICRQ